MASCCPRLAERRDRGRAGAGRRGPRRPGSATGAFDSAIACWQQNFPETPALLAAKGAQGRLPVAQRRAGRRRARLFDESRRPEQRQSPTAARRCANLLAPYFDLLASDGSADAAAPRCSAPARCCSGRASPRPRRSSRGNCRKATARQRRLFRLAVARTREIVRKEAEIARLAAKPSADRRATSRTWRRRKASLEALRADQVAAAGPARRLSALQGACARHSPSSPSCRRRFAPGEGYYKMMVVGDALYAIYATNDGARAMRLAPTRGMMADEVTALRNSIVRIENGEAVTEPFDVGARASCTCELFGPIDAEVQGLKHLIFEPDGPMLQLPPYLLDRQPGRARRLQGAARRSRRRPVRLQRRRLARPRPRSFDLGRAREASSTCARSAPTPRAPGLSRAWRECAVVANPAGGAVADECDWPIADLAGADLAGRTDGRPKPRSAADKAAVVTGAAFNDAALLSDSDSSTIIGCCISRRTAWSPRRGPTARRGRRWSPSFGGPGSDGLLSFREIFDLKLDADVVILSACDTAGSATPAPRARRASLTGGNYALDGLVRAFVGAGARSVVASHWPVPDDYDATKRLIGGLVEATAGPAAGRRARPRRRRS